MMPRQHNPGDYAGLKTGFRVLVQQVGGLEAASAVTGYPVSRLAEAYSLTSDRMPRVDHVADLEAIAPAPLVTFHLARLCGHILVPLRGRGGVAGEALATVIRDAGALGAEVVAAMADGRLSGAERAQLRERLALLGRAVAAADVALAEPTE